MRIIYDKDIDINKKRRLLAVSEKNKKIIPTIFKGVKKLKEYLKEPDTLLLLLMSYQPDNLEDEVAAHDFVVINKRKMKMIVPRKTGSEI